MRIAIGGFQHETNTFAPSKATFDDFAPRRRWPPLLAPSGEQIFAGVDGMNLPLAGFIAHMSGTSHQLLLFGVTSRDAIGAGDRRCLRAVFNAAAGRHPQAEPDAVYLDLHGAWSPSTSMMAKARCCGCCAQLSYGDPFLSSRASTCQRDGADARTGRRAHRVSAPTAHR
jgi:microcystin degradation protein MlrC